MTEGLLYFAPAFLAGMILGIFYFGVLWLTVRRLTRYQHPSLWFVASFLFRNAVAAAGFYLVMAGDWRRLFAALAGFILIRVVIVRRVGGKTAMAQSKEAGS
ncbi:MAG: N-ATPase subunit AtpR [Gammaproteobacteria bacterium]